MISPWNWVWHDRPLTQWRSFKCGSLGPLLSGFRQHFGKLWLSKKYWGSTPISSIDSVPKECDEQKLFWGSAIWGQQTTSVKGRWTTQHGKNRRASPLEGSPLPDDAEHGNFPPAHLRIVFLFLFAFPGRVFFTKKLFGSRPTCSYPVPTHVPKLVYIYIYTLYSRPSNLRVDLSAS